MNGSRIFLLSPAHCGGKRAQLLLRSGADFPLARQLRSRAECMLGEAFTFLSGLYFRGKLAYAQAFAWPAPRQQARAIQGALVITTNRGLADVNQRVTLGDLRAMGRGDIDAGDARYRRPLERDLAALAQTLGEDGRVILLGSIASGKYCDILLHWLGSRLLFPQEFIGRGDMSRGGLMLRCVEERRELTYIPVAGAIRRGPRPPRLARRTARSMNL